jgi:hypothetical protein
VATMVRGMCRNVAMQRRALGECEPQYPTCCFSVAFMN